jgi:hypothetical protein
MSVPEVGLRTRHVCFPPVSDQTADIAGDPLSADIVEKLENAKKISRTSVFSCVLRWKPA